MPPIFQSNDPDAASETIARLEEQLREAQKMGAVGLLAGGIAHDFSNLLTAINGYSDMLLTGSGLPEEARAYIAVVHDAGERAAGLVRRLLAFSRHAAQEAKIVNLTDIVIELSRLLQRLLPENIQFTNQLEADLGMVRADPNAIQQAIMNLVINARDAMPRGGTLEIKTTNVRLSAPLRERHLDLPAGDYILMAVNDNGAGMDETAQKHLFEPFYTTKPLGAGTGLGLANVHRVVEQSGGWISISSERGRGTSVKIYLPCVDGRLAQAGTTQKTVPEGGHETILVVEDSAEVRRFIRIALQNLGYTVIEAASAEQAVAACRASTDRIDLLVTDVVLPDSTGQDVAKRLTEARPELPVLYISGYPQDFGGIEAVPGTGIEFLQKPFAADTLGLRVRALLRRCRRILVVDDDPEVARFTSQVLSQAGFEVLTAEEGNQALSIVSHQSVDLVITDLVMPVKEGLETIRALREIKPSLAIIAMSGAFGGQFLKPALHLGAQICIAKPFTIAELLDAVHQALAADRGAT